MANLASSSIDDQQERHFIGDLLSEEDVFGQPTNNCIDSNSSAPLSSGGVLPSAGPVGPSLSQAFWPEPPPPYSPYSSVSPPQWASMNRQTGAILAPPVTNIFGQSPTATAVTRTDFYQAPFNAPGEWDPVTGTPMDPYMPMGSPMSFSAHPAVQVLKPGVPHHYHNMYHHHQNVVNNHRHYGATHGVVPHSGTRVSPMGPTYSEIGSSAPLHVDTIPHRMPSKNSRKLVGSTFQQVESAPSSPGVHSGGPMIPAGKSYRDAASNKHCVTSTSPPASVTSHPAASVRHTSSSSSGGVGTPALGARRITASQRNTSERHSSGDSTMGGSHQTAGGGAKTIIGLNPVEKTNIGIGKRSSENEFQKIVHKKSKGGKGSKGEQIVADEDGLTGAQAVDASSRYEVLQSLGSQASMNSDTSIRTTRRSLSTGVRVDSSRLNKTGVLSAVSKDDAEVFDDLKDVNVNELLDDAAQTEENELTKLSNETANQRSQVKKVLLGSRRKQSEQNILLDSSRAVSRKQRGAARKRQNNALDHLNFFLLALLSLVKRSAHWIFDLVLDFSLQLRDVAVYGALATYSKVTLSCQRWWYYSIEALRSFWNNLCSFNARNVWANNESEDVGWGLSENIQLPSTGDEAMERLLRCHSQDAYGVLGLRADCTDDDIKRYYKRQAVLVHPDKNRANGADEAFKILSSAFEAIGTTDARVKYNLANLHRNPLHKEMEELWEKLREKMCEARNTMHCDCGVKHTRVPVPGMRSQEARYCKKCHARHPAKHNDIWAETRFGGFLWVYYACLDGVIYDITQWATCPNNRLKHMKANSHVVQYRLISTAGPSAGKGDANSRRNKRSLQQEMDELDCMDGPYGNHLDACGCSIGAGGLDGIAASQQASYRPPERRSLDPDRPRRAGRRRRLR